MGVFLSVNNISKSFAGVKALKKINLTLNEGEVRCLVGENGCGKSTLIKIISGVYTPDEGSGEIVIGGKSYQKLTPNEAIKNGIQVIYQDFSIFPNLSVAENIALNTLRTQKKKTVKWNTLRKIAQAALDNVGVKMDLYEKVEKLSVADKQLVAICRAINQDAKLIVLDEPTTALTKKEVERLLDIIRELKSRGIAIIFVTHKLDEVIEVSDTVSIVRNGENVIDGPISEFDMTKFSYYMTGKEIVDVQFDQQLKDGEELLRLEHLTLKDGFADISFKLNRGEIIAVTGLLGSGRTELAQALFGQYKTTGGKLFVRGKEVHFKSINDAIKAHIGYVPEDRNTEGLFLTRSIADNIGVTVLDRYKKPMNIIDRKKIKGVADEWVGKLRIKTPDSNNVITTLSGGNAQRVAIGKWLANDPQILILNGPTVGVDIGSKAEIHKILREFANQGMGVIIISDDLPEVLTNCNRVLVMKHGRIVGEFNTSETNEAALAQILS